MKCFCQRQGLAACLAEVVGLHCEQYLSATACCSADAGSVRECLQTVHSKCLQLMHLANPVQANHNSKCAGEKAVIELCCYLTARFSPLRGLTAGIPLWSGGETCHDTTVHHVAVLHVAGPGTAILVVAAQTMAELAVQAKRTSCPCLQAFENLSQASSRGLASLWYRCPSASRQGGLRPWKTSWASLRGLLKSRSTIDPLPWSKLYKSAATCRLRACSLSRRADADSQS